MGINEEITALLSGDLDDEVRIAELMHVLAVSPEKRNVLREQIRMSRAFTAMGGGIVPPHAADAGILAGISAIDREMAGAMELPADSPAVPAPVAAGASWPRMLMFGAVMTVLGLGVGYLLRGDAPVRHTDAAARMERPALRDDRQQVVAGLRDSLDGARRDLADLAAEHRAALRDLAALRSASGRNAYDRNGSSIGTSSVEPRQAIADARPVPTMGTPEISPVELRRAALPVPHDPVATSRAGAVPLDGGLHTDGFAGSAAVRGPWQVGMRDHFRLSLPRVYGLSDSRSILFDKELMVGYRLGDGGESPISALQIAAAFGETQFTQVYHSGQSGRTPDLIIEQSPTVLYGRLMLASRIFETTDVTGRVEFGGGATVAGGTTLGPIGTFGLNMEYRPVDVIALHLGLSSWLLWTEHDGQVYTSTNLNGHMGIALGF